MNKIKTILSIAAIAIIFFTMIPSLSMNAEAAPGAAYAPGELIIGLENMAVAEFRPAISEIGATVKREMPQIGAIIIRVPQGSEDAFIANIRKMPGVAYVERNGIGEAALTPNDTHWNLLWNMRMIKADKAWDTYTTGTHMTITVAILDTGVDYTHDDLMANYQPGGYDWVNDDQFPMDGHSHGTHCAGIVAATMGNALGVAGVAQVKIWAEKILTDGGSGNNGDLTSGILHAADNGVNVISMSLQNYPYSAAVEAAVNYAYARNVLLVGAAGNAAKNIDISPSYPASYANVMAVSSTTSTDVFDSSYSNYGNKIEVSAPGTSVYSTVPTDSYGYKTGTSMACPHVAGLAALIMAYKPYMSASMVRSALHAAVDDKGAVGKDIYYGYGRINAQKIIVSSDRYQYNFRLSPYSDRVWLNVSSAPGGMLINGKVNISTPHTCYPAPVLGWASGNNFQMVFDYRTTSSCYELGLLVGTISPAAGNLYRTSDGTTWVGPVAITFAASLEADEDVTLGPAAVIAGEPGATLYVEGLNPGGTPMTATYTGGRYAIRYVPTISYPLKKVELITGGTTGPVTVQLRTDSGGYPSNTTLKQVTFTMSSTLGWQGAEFDTSYPVIAGTTYWIVFEPVTHSRASVATSGTLVTHCYDNFADGTGDWDYKGTGYAWMARFYREVQHRFQYKFIVNPFIDRSYVNLTSQPGGMLIYGLTNLTVYSTCYPAPLLGWAYGNQFVFAFDYRSAVGASCFELGFLVGTISTASGKLYRTQDGSTIVGPVNVNLAAFGELGTAASADGQ